MSSVRRRLLAAIAANVTDPPVHVGNPTQTSPTSINSGGLTRTFVNVTEPADATSTLTTVTLRTTEASTARDGYIMVGTLSGTTYTVRAITGLITFTTDGSGIATATISLPVVVGDYIGLWTTSALANGWVRMSGTSGDGSTVKTGQTTSPTTVPNSGDTIALTLDGNRRLNLYAEH